MGLYDRPLTFDGLVDLLAQHRDYTKSLEKRLKEVERQRDAYRDECDPNWRRRDMEAALDGEIRLLREQG